jgi:hypothetical protein
MTLEPRKYWINISNKALVESRDEYRAMAKRNSKYECLLQTADNIDDELKRRKMICEDDYHWLKLYEDSPWEPGKLENGYWLTMDCCCPFDPFIVGPKIPPPPDDDEEITRCPACFNGKIWNTDKEGYQMCYRCHGTGRIIKEEQHDRTDEV